MIHKTISTSVSVNRLSLEARLLFTWMIPHTDDEGRMPGEPEWIGFTIIPYLKLGEKEIIKLLNELVDQDLIYYWEYNKRKYVEFVNFYNYQKLRKDRLKPSTYPSYRKPFDDQTTTKRQPKEHQKTSPGHLIESNINEYNNNRILDQKTINDSTLPKLINPHEYSPSNEIESAAKETWKKLEPNNPLSFQTTYLNAARKGLPASKFYEYSSEIKQAKNVKNNGAVFNTKVKEYFEN